MNRIDCSVITQSILQYIKKNRILNGKPLYLPRETKLYCLKKTQIQLTVIGFVCIRLTPFVVIVTATTRHTVSESLLLTGLAQNHC